MKFTHKVPAKPGQYWAIRHAPKSTGEPEPVGLLSWGLGGGAVIIQGCVEWLAAQNFLWGDEIVRPEVEEVKA
jgi:hypothetical protein